MKQVCWALLGWLVALTGGAHAQSVDTRHFTDAEGLLENTPFAMLQDRQGNLWVGTRGGACWYDGYRFHPLPPGRSAADQNVTALAEAPDGTLWFGHSYGGLSWRRNGRMQSFLPKGYDPPNLVQALLCTNSRTLWVGSDRGLFRCGFSSTDTVVTHPALLPNEPEAAVNAICRGPAGHLLVATESGLTAVEIASGRAVPLGLPHMLRELPCSFVRRVADTLFWVSSPAFGVVRLSCAPGTLAWRARRYTTDNGLCSNNALNVLQDAAGQVWVMTTAGLSRLDPSGKVDCYPDAEHLIDYPAVLLEDREGNLWSGRGSGGIRQRLGDERLSYFTSVARQLQPAEQLSALAAYGLPKGEITTVLEDEPGTYWLGSSRGTIGFRLAAPPGQQLTALPPIHPPTDGNARADRYVYCLYRETRGPLWQGSANGLARYNFATQRWQAFDDVPGLVHESVLSIVPDARGRLWIATQSKGVTVYDPSTGRFRSFAETDADGPGTLDCWKLFRDARGTIWLGTESNGLFRLTSSPHDHFERVAGSEKFTGLRDLADDRRGGLWLVSYHTGLLHFDGRQLQTRNDYHRSLPPATVVSVATDSAGHVWLGTSQGLDAFDPVTKRVARYGVGEGFWGHGASPGAILLDRAGRLWVGTQQGLMRYDPRLARHNPVPPLTRLTGVRLFLRDTTLRPGATLPHQLNHLTFDYIGVSLTNPSRVRYRYRLRGFEPQWIGPLAATSATYTNLPPGTYSFEVEAANEDGVWNAQPAALAFTIQPPWWRTWWAYLLYAAGVGLVLYGLWRYTLGRERLRHDLRLERLALGHMQELDRVKTNFFTNISHEFRTPLTLILGPAEELALESADAGVRRKSGLILRNAHRLLRLINQLLDLSKLEAGAMPLVPTAGDIARLARQQAAVFASMAEARNIRFLTIGPASLPLVFDAPRLDVVLNNLLSNALRFTPTGGEVALTWSETPAGTGPAGVELTVRDTGPGIAAEHLPHLFNRFYQGAHPTTPGAQPGTGVGLTLVKELTELHGGTVTVTSPPDEGATFTVRLPYGLTPAPANRIAEALASADGSATAWHQPDAAERPLPDAEALTPEAEADVVLLIEDNADVREFVRSSLAPAGYRLLEAPDGLRGVAIALEQVPDLILSDVMMPGLDGYGVVRQLKAHPATSHVPIVLLTAKSGASDRIEGLETGADAYLGKPFAARELRAQVRNLLALRDRTRTYARTIQHPIERGTIDAPPVGAEAEEVAPAPLPVQLSALDRGFLMKVAAAVAANLAENDFDVDQLSSAVALSRTQMQRKLRALTGQAPAEYIRTARLSRALELLRERAGTVSEIGYLVGFSSPAHFSTVFSRQFGYPPSDVARQ